MKKFFALISNILFVFSVLILILAIVFVGKALQQQQQLSRNLSNFDYNNNLNDEYKSNLLLPNIALDFTRNQLPKNQESNTKSRKTQSFNMNITKSKKVVNKVIENLLTFRLPKEIVPNQVRTNI